MDMSPEPERGIVPRAQDGALEPRPPTAMPSRYRPKRQSQRRLDALLRPLRILKQGLRALGWSAFSALRASLTPFRLLARYDAPLVEGDAERVLERAVRIATRAGAPRVLSDHIFAALLEEEPVRRALVVAGAPLRELEARLCGDGICADGAYDDEMPEDEAAAEDEVNPIPATLAAEAKSVVGRAVGHAFQAERTQVIAGDLLVAVLEENEGDAVAWLKAHGISPTDLIAAVAHGRDALDEPAVPGNAPELEVMLYDDEYTSRSLVFDALRTAWGMSHGDAQRALVRLDSHGKVSLGVLPRAEAVARTRALNAYARSQGAPLLARAVPSPEARRDDEFPRAERFVLLPPEQPPGGAQPNA